MKAGKIGVIIGVAVLAVIVAVSMTQAAKGAITGSAHDFSAKGWNPGGEICVVCHTPHNATTSASAPLWNHALTVSVFTLYSSTTLNAVVGQPVGVSKLCLSCHDGTVALDSFGGATGTTMITGGALVGTNLSDNHPISFTYDTSLATLDGGLFNPSAALSGLGGTIAADMLFGGKLECGSCHDVHNGAGLANLLIKTNAGSALCLTCHDK